MAGRKQISELVGQLLNKLYGDPDVTAGFAPDQRLRLVVLGGVRLYVLVLLTTITVFTPLTMALDPPGFVFNVGPRLATFALMVGGMAWTFRKDYAAAGEGLALASLVAFSMVSLWSVRVSGVPDHPFAHGPVLIVAGLGLFVPVRPRVLVTACAVLALMPVPLWLTGAIEARLTLKVLYLISLAAIALFGVLGAHARRTTLADQFAAEAALRELNAELESRVEARTHQLQVSEARFEGLFHHAPQAMLMVDSSQCVAQSNRRAQKLFGYDAAGLGGHPIAELLPHDPQEHQQDMLTGLFVEGERRSLVSGRQVRAVRRDGSTFAADVSLVPVDIGGDRQVLAGVTDITDKLAARQLVARSLHEKETLLKEIHHRVKNNLQIISSLLMLQADQITNEQARTLLQESVFRVRSMALIHQQLYGVESLAHIDLGAYAQRLVDSLRAALAPNALVQVRSPRIEVTVELAVPLGLILNELVTNAFKYGLPSPVANAPPRPPSASDVLVEVAVDDGNLRLTVSDSGPGLPEGIEVGSAPTLGLQVVHSLVRQIRGELTVSCDGGTRFELISPLPEMA